MKLKLLSAVLMVALPLCAQAEDIRILDTAKGEVQSESGEIKKDTSYRDLQKKGMQKLWDAALPYAEGACRLGTVAYRGTASELEVFWKGSAEAPCYKDATNAAKWQDFKTPELVRIRRPDSAWVSDQGIKVGTTIEELEKLNDGTVGFMGFGWDMGGACCKGKGFSEHFGLTLAADEDVVHGKSPAADYYAEHLTGDKRIESKEIPADIKKKLNIRVKEIFLNF